MNNLTMAFLLPIANTGPFRRGELKDAPGFDIKQPVFYADRSMPLWTPVNGLKYREISLPGRQPRPGPGGG